MNTDFASLERELRGDTYSPGEDSVDIPDAYADLAEEYGVTDSHDDDDEDDDVV